MARKREGLSRRRPRARGWGSINAATRIEEERQHATWPWGGDVTMTRT